MREHLYRGFHPDENGNTTITFNDEQIRGEWLYWNEWGRLEKSIYPFKFYVNEIHIIPETVGEYTGLTDRNGIKIFEGALVRTQEYLTRPYSKTAKGKRFIGVVEHRVHLFNSGKCAGQIYEVQWTVNVPNGYGKYVHGGWSEFYDCEVVGNIYENPELLQGEE